MGAFLVVFHRCKGLFLKPEAEKDPREIVKAIEQNKVTTMHFVPLNAESIS